MSSPLKPAAFLDLDGPILDVSIRHYRVYTKIVDNLGGNAIPQHDYWVAKRDKISDREILARSHLADEAESYQEAKLQLIESLEYLAFDRLQPQTFEILRRITAQYRAILVTLRQSREALTSQLAALKIDVFFADVLSRPTGTLPGWETKCEMIRGSNFGVDPRGFFVGDTETDVKAGRELGLRTVAIANGIRNEARLKLLQPDWLLPSLSALPTTPLLL